MCHGNESANGWCGCCGGWSYHKMGHHGMIRLILAIAILAIVFKVGVEFGEFKGEFGGYGRHMQFGPRAMMNSDYGMMGGDYYTNY